MADGSPYARILFVPHAGPKYTHRAMKAAAAAIPAGRFVRAYVVSTAHSVDLFAEHSYDWMRDGLKDTHLFSLLDTRRVLYALPATTLQATHFIIRALAEEPDALVIVNSDLTHYGPAYDNAHFGTAQQVKEMLLATWEQPLLDALATAPDRTHAALAAMQAQPCGTIAITALADACARFGYIGRVLEHYSSLDVEPSSASLVSYVAMSFGPRPWTDDWPMSFIQRWPIFAETKNAAFVQLLDPQHGRDVACIGELTEDTIAQKVARIAPSMLIADLESGRLADHPPPLSGLIPHVTILAQPRNWRTIAQADFGSISSIGPKDDAGRWQGIRCVWPNGRDAIFIPAVWREQPSARVIDLLRALSSKAGFADPDAWREAARIYMFTELGTFT